MAMKIPTSPRYRKRVGAFRGVDIKHDESVIDFSVASKCYNFDTTSGSLREGYGIKTHERVPDKATRYFVYRYYSETAGEYVDQYIFQEPTGILWFFDTVKNRTLPLSGFAYAATEAINYRLNSKDTLLLSSAGRGLVTWDGSKVREHATPEISSMALHYERLFITSPTEPTKVFFSDDLDPTNWNFGANEGGFIELLDERGALNKVVSFINYLYIFREHGISRVTASGSQDEFAVNNLFVATGRIYPESIAKCGGVIVFAASDGLYRFDGYDCSKILTNLDGLIVGARRASAYFDGKYYLSCTMDFRDDEKVGCEADDTHVSNGLLVYDVATGEYSMSRGLDIEYMNVCTFCGEDFLMARDGAHSGVIARCGKRFDAPLEKYWQSPESDFGASDKTKVLREVYTYSDVDHTVGVRGKKKKTVEVRAGMRRLRFNANAKTLSLSVSTTADECNIRPPTLVYSTF